MTQVFAFLLGLAVFVVAIVGMIATKLDLFVGGIDLALAIALILVTAPAVYLNRS
jgi:hypothetical protein